MAYDPVKAHAYYEMTKELKGRQPGNKQAAKLKPIKGAPAKGKPKVSDRKSSKGHRAEVAARLSRLTIKVDKLNKALKEAKAELAEKRRGAQKSRESKRQTEKENSDGKSSSAERAASKKYRDKHKGKSAGGGDKDKKPKDLTVDQLEARVDKIQVALSSAKAQVKAASAELRSLKHSALADSVPTQPAPSGLDFSTTDKEGDSQNGSNP